MLKKLSSFVIVGTILFGSSDGNAANLVANGSFEDGLFTNEIGGYMILAPGETPLSDWAIVNGDVAWGMSPSDGFLASDGVGFVDLSSVGASSTMGTLEQELSTSIGTEYLFSFESQGQLAGVSIGGVSLALTAGVTLDNWTTYTSVFTAVSLSSLLSIANVPPPDSIVFVDNVSVTEIDVSAVPLPAALPLLGGALTLMGFFGWRKRRMAAT